MKYNLVATITIAQEVEANSEDQAKEIFRQRLGLFITNPYNIEVAEEAVLSDIEESPSEVKEPT
jgi:hypothetical protein